ncbi:MAG: hypothetical protein K9N46_14960 [Candidatus Marinimicrobia bacterium]|nr:hypothetical protein [Candidatus Neomarinimicrobiota bacterium]MCF7828546.1 hypothetical protein [Candidatus Neomarinimicrobiota bacterium]MCF7882031.1 hypothetical protein [Candidatus Neomarinimicrobiota bacterium]
MPELPDVEVFREYFQSTALHQEIAGVEILDDRILEGISAGKLREKLAGQSFADTHRHGKHLFAKLSSQGWLMLHFGMTGYLKYAKNTVEEPSHTRVLLKFANGNALAYSCMRLLGKVGWTPEMAEYISHHDLGPDALALDENQFTELMGQKRGMIKSALMDQSHIAGLGNIYVDEILFQAEFHPKRQVPEMSGADFRHIFGHMREVLNTAVACQVDVDRFPENYLIHYRDPEKQCPKCGAQIQKIKVASRSTYFCPNHQSL